MLPKTGVAFVALPGRINHLTLGSVNIRINQHSRFEEPMIKYFKWLWCSLMHSKYWLPHDDVFPIECPKCGQILNIKKK